MCRVSFVDCSYPTILLTIKNIFSCVGVVVIFVVSYPALPLVNFKYYLIQNNPAVKKVCGPKKAIVKKDVKSRVAAKKWL